MNKTQARDLLLVADLLDSNKVPDKQFDMGSWGYQSPECGTTHCVLGWAATIPELKKKGLRLRKDPSTPMYQVVRCVGHRDLDSAEAGARFFGLTNEEVQFLFFGNQNKFAAANSIRRVVGKYFPVRTVVG